MKKILISTLCLIFCIVSYPRIAHAATPTPSPTSTTDSPTDIQKQNDLMNQITKLKDKIASQVAKMDLVEKRGFIGTITDVSATQITVNDLHNKTRFIDVDEITKFASPSAKASFGISDLTKGTMISALGTYNKESQHLLARFINVVSKSAFLTGHITDIDRSNYDLYLTSDDNKKTYVDIEAFTKTYSYTQATDFKKSGFSKIETGNRAVIIGDFDPNNPSHVIANRILIFPDLPPDPNISLATQSPTETLSATPTITTKTKQTTTK